MGPIYLEGAGDPVLATRSYAAAYLGGRATRMAALALPLRRRGIRLVRGPIVADERIFDSRRLGLASYYRYYASPLSGLPTNQDYAGNGRAPYVSSPRWPRPSASRPPWAGSACPRSARCGRAPRRRTGRCSRRRVRRRCR